MTTRTPSEQAALDAIRVLCVEHDLDRVEMYASREAGQTLDGFVTVLRGNVIRCSACGITSAVAELPGTDERRKELLDEATKLEAKLADTRAQLDALPKP